MLKRRALSLITALVLLFSTSASAQAGYSNSLLNHMQKNAAAQPAQEQKDIVLIVEVEGEPVSAANSMQTFNARAAEEQQRRNLQTQAQVQEEIQNVVEVPAEAEQIYTNVLNGFSIKVDSLSEIDKIKAIPGVKNVSVSRTFHLPEPVEEEPDPAYGTRLATSTGLIGADKLAETGYNGEGQVVAVIDSELDTDHAFFSDAPNNPKYSKEDMAKLLTQENMHMNLQGQVDDVYKSAKIPFAYDYVRDSPDVYNTSNIHGTHVSGIVAGKGGPNPTGEGSFSGVAPEAQLVFMKVFDGERASEAIIIQAIDDAAKLGVSAINMSLGADYAMSEDNPVFEKAIENARAAGIFVACASGNATLGYENGAVRTENIEYAAAGTPAGYSAATSVAGSANSAIFLYQFSLDTDTYIPFVEGSGETKFVDAFAGKPYDYVYADYGTEEDFAKVDVQGKIALVQQGGPEGMMSTEKFANAETAGAIGCIFWTTKPLEYGMTVSPSTIPTCIIQNEQGKTMSARGSGTLRTDPTMASVPVGKDDKLYTYTSWGTDGSLELKPEIMAPGEYIYSSYPSDSHDEYITFSGTSMATPHIAGAVALLNQWYEDKNREETVAPKDGKNRAEYFENLMMSTSTIIKQENGVPYSPRRQSAGLLNLENAIQSPVILRGDNGKTKLSLGDKLGASFPVEFQVENTSSNEATYDKVHVYVMTDGYVEKDGETYVDGTVKLLDTGFDRNVIVSSGQTVDFEYEISLDTEILEKNLKHFPNGFYIDGFVELSDHANKLPPVHIPFMGFYGDWLKAPLFDAAVYDGEYTIQGTRLSADLSEDQWQDLGYNLLTKELTGKDHIAFSPNGDGIFDHLAVNSCLLRDAGEIVWELRNAAGELVSTAHDENVSKFFFDTVPFDLPENLPDGDYTVTGSGYHYYDKEKTHPYTFGDTIPVTVDTQMPEITAVQITEEDGRTYASVSAADNNCLQAVALSAEDQAESDVWEQAVDNASGTVKFDITGYDPKKLTVQIVDYAMNELAAPLLTEIATVQNISLSGFTVVFDRALSLTAADFSLSSNDKEIELSSVEKVNDTTYRVNAALDYATQYKLSVIADHVRLAAITFTTPGRSSGGGNHGGITVTDPEVTPLPAPVFRDVAPTDWFYTAVTEMARRGVIQGMGDGSFAPYEPVKRADFLVLIMRAGGIQPDMSSTDNFADAGSAYYSGYLAKAKALGYVTGTGNNLFRPEASITRQDMCVMLYRILLAEDRLPQAAGEPMTFTDSADIAPYAQTAIRELSAAGVINGCGGKVNPLGSTLRCEAAQVLYRIF